MDGIFMRKRTIFILLGLAILFYAGTAVISARQQSALAEKLLRLHVVANSDTETDQSNKLQVRDSVLALASDYLSEAQTAQAAAELLQPHLGQLQAAAEECLQSLGAPAQVVVTLTEEDFNTRVYDSFSLPAGTYQTLRVVIGAGEGHNWWCVVFPSLCTAATAEALEQSAVEAGLSLGELSWITDDSTEVKLQFKTLEWLQKLRAWLR
jgi:stage II sporulation protein R